MLDSLLMLIILSLFLGTGVWLFFIYAVKKGAFDDPEAPKYRMLDDDDDLPPASKPPSGKDEPRNGDQNA